ncbi:uncharacterized protein LOC125195072, partial [Salvia hispanica]|uniref:uncharacterized protein LOC125195072 n=1 Tax=Salvia hispanica TaxID=49212 RepID=UPI002009A350
LSSSSSLSLSLLTLYALHHRHRHRHPFPSRSSPAASLFLSSASKSTVYVLSQFRSLGLPSIRIQQKPSSKPIKPQNAPASSSPSIRSRIPPNPRSATKSSSPNPFNLPEFNSLLFNPLDSSSSCSPSQPFQMPAFLPPKSAMPSLFTANFDNGSFDLSCDQSYFRAPNAVSAPMMMGFN